MEFITTNDGVYPFIISPKFLIPKFSKSISPEDIGIYPVDKPKEPKYRTTPGDTLAGISLLIIWICFPFGIMMTIFVEDKGGGPIMLLISLFAFLYQRLQNGWGKLIENENSIIRNNYNSKLHEWKTYQNEIKRIQSINSDQEKLESFYTNERNHALKNIIQHSSFVSKKGASELPFIDRLKRKMIEINQIQSWKSKIEIIDNGGIIPKFHFPTSENYRPYQPDILLKCTNSGMYFDIEIDEPYTLEKKQPIHYINEKNNSYSDEKRDFEIIQSNWVVIRFCEEQIIKYPEKCISLILLSIKFFNQQIPNLSFNIFVARMILDGPPEVNRWTKSESLVLSFKKYREKYLNKMM
jgi:hypothetical protein